MQRLMLMTTNATNTAPISVSDPARFPEKHPPYTIKNGLEHYEVPGRTGKGGLRPLVVWEHLDLMRDAAVAKFLLTNKKATPEQIEEVRLAVKLTIEELQHLASGGVRDGNSPAIHPAKLAQARLDQPIIGAFGCFGNHLSITGSVMFGAFTSVEPINEPYRSFPLHRSIVRRHGLRTGTFAADDVSDLDKAHAADLANHEGSLRRKKHKEELRLLKVPAEKAALKKKFIEEEKAEMKADENYSRVSWPQGRSDGMAYIPEGTVFNQTLDFVDSTDLEIGLVLSGMRQKALYRWHVGGSISTGHGGGFNIDYTARIPNKKLGWIDDALITIRPPQPDFPTGVFIIEPAPGVTEANCVTLRCYNAWLNVDVTKFDYSIETMKAIAATGIPAESNGETSGISEALEVSEDGTEGRDMELPVTLPGKIDVPAIAKKTAGRKTKS